MPQTKAVDDAALFNKYMPVREVIETSAQYNMRGARAATAICIEPSTAGFISCRERSLGRVSLRRLSKDRRQTPVVTYNN